VLDSAPCGAVPGRAVTHTITLSGTGVVAAVRVTFTTTVALDGITAAANQGGCPVVTAVRVVCELGDVDVSSATAGPTVTISGTVHAGTAPGTLVQNLVSISSSDRAGDPETEVVSNAYLVAAGETTPPAAVNGGGQPSAAPPGPNNRRTNRLPAAGAVVALAAVALVGLVGSRRVLRLRRRRS